MAVSLSIISVLVGLGILFSIRQGLKSKSIIESQSIVWIFFAILYIVLGFFPGILPKLSEWLGLTYPPTLLFSVFTGMLILISYSHTIKISNLIKKNNELAQQISLLKHQIENADNKDA